MNAAHSFHRVFVVIYSPEVVSSGIRKVRSDLYGTTKSACQLMTEFVHSVRVGYLGKKQTLRVPAYRLRPATGMKR